MAQEIDNKSFANASLKASDLRMPQCSLWSNTEALPNFDRMNEKEKSEAELYGLLTEDKLESSQYRKSVKKR